MEIIYISGALLLAVALAYGAYMYYSRNKANDRITEEATRQMREDPDAYMNGGRQKLQDQIEPKSWGFSDLY